MAAINNHRRRTILDFAVERQWISNSQAAEIKKYCSRTKDKVGSVLVEQGLLTSEQLEQALSWQKSGVVPESKVVHENHYLASWSTAQALEWLHSLQLQEYADAFQKHHVDGLTLINITTEELKDELGMEPLGHRKRLLNMRDLLLKQPTPPRRLVRPPPGFEHRPLPTPVSDELAHVSLTVLADSAIASPSSDTATLQLFSDKSNVNQRGEAAQAPDLVKLQPGTDLREVPPNWLLSDSRVTESPKPHSLPALTAEALQRNQSISGLPNPIIASADDLSNVFRAPYSQAPISLTVNRFGNALVLDKPDGPDFSGRSGSKKTKAATTERTLLSKLIYRTIGESDQAREENTLTVEDNVNQISTEKHAADTFRRTLQWQFDDTTLFVGSDVIVFKDEIRLTLQGQPSTISSLAALDEWLTNVLGALPSLAICYHQEGVVQGYTVTDTQDIPQALGVVFDPEVVIAQGRSFLKFIHDNCTKENCTYWLFRDSQSDLIRLFEIPDLREIPVSIGTLSDHTGIFCYRLATRLMDEHFFSDKALVMRILERALSLLESSRHRQIRIDCHRRLASILYAPSTESTTFDTKSQQIVLRSSHGVADNFMDIYGPPNNLFACSAALAHLEAALKEAIQGGDEIIADLRVSVLRTRLAKAWGLHNDGHFGEALCLIHECLIFIDSPKLSEMLGACCVCAGDIFRDLHTTTSITDQNTQWAQRDLTITIDDKNSSLKLPVLPSMLTIDREANLTLAIQFYLRAVKIGATRAKARLAAAYESLALFFISNGRFTKAMQHCRQGITLFQSSDDQTTVSLMRYHLAVLTLNSVQFNHSPSIIASQSQFIGSSQQSTLAPVDDPQLHAALEKALEMFKQVQSDSSFREVHGREWRHSFRLVGSIHAKFASEKEALPLPKFKSEDVMDELKKAVASFEAADAKNELGAVLYRLGLISLRVAESDDHPNKMKTTVAMNHLEKAAQLLNPASAPMDLICLRLDLVKAYNKMTHGSRVYHLEKAICHLLALEPFFITLTSTTTSEEGVPLQVLNESASTLDLWMRQQLNPAPPQPPKDMLWKLVVSQLHEHIRSLLKQLGTNQPAVSSHYKQLYKLALEQQASGTNFFQAAASQHLLRPETFAKNE